MAEVVGVGAEPELEARILAPPETRILGVRLLNGSRLVLLIQQKPKLVQDFPHALDLMEDQAAELWNSSEDC